MNIANLTSLIDALRAETANASITPESLGGLLQQVVDAIGLASTEADMNTVKRWKGYLQQLTRVMTSIKQGSEDRNNVYFTPAFASLATGENTIYANALSISPATTERAGVMRAQHVSDLNTAKTNISNITKDLSSLSASIENLVSDVKIDHYTSYSLVSGVWCPSGSTSANLCLHVLFKSGKVATSVISTGYGTGSSSFYHIVCEAGEDELKVKGASKLVASGYVPYIFRYTLKRNRLTRKNGTYYRGRKKRGWHVFYGEGLAKVVNDYIYFNEYDEEYRHFKGIWGTSSCYLVKVKVFKDNDDDITHLYVGYGKKTIDAVKGRRFKFGIAFGPKQIRGKFDFTRLVTNIAPFNVHVRVNPLTDKCYTDFCL